MKEYIAIVKKRLKELKNDDERLAYLRGAGKTHDAFMTARHAGKVEAQKFLQREYRKIKKRAQK